jgi:hypothetical protein
MIVVIGAIAGFVLGVLSAWAIRKGMDQDRESCSNHPNWQDQFVPKR